MVRIFFHYHFFNMDISITTEALLTKFVYNMYMEGAVSPNFGMGLSFYFMSKTGNFLMIFKN